MSLPNIAPPSANTIHSTRFERIRSKLARFTHFPRPPKWPETRYKLVYAYNRARPYRQKTFIQFLLCAVVLIVTGSIVTAFSIVFRQRPYEGRYWDGILPGRHSVYGPYMLAEIIGLDIPGRTFTIRWTIDPFAGQETDDRFPPLGFPPPPPGSRVRADFYRDEDVIRGNYGDNTKIFTYDSAIHHRLRWLPSFETTISFLSILSLGDVTWGEEIYPFDDFLGGILFTAKKAGTVDSQTIVGVKLLGGFFGFTFDLDVEDVEDANGQQYIAIQISCRRAVIVRIFAVTLVIISWFVAIGILWLTIREVFGRVQPGRGDTISLPITALFALPAVRAFLPGDPPLGCRLDYIGTIPQIVIIGSCAFLTLLARTHQGARPKKYWDRPPSPTP